MIVWNRGNPSDSVECVWTISGRRVPRHDGHITRIHCILYHVRDVVCSLFYMPSDNASKPTDVTIRSLDLRHGTMTPNSYVYLYAAALGCAALLLPVSAQQVQSLDVCPSTTLTVSLLMQARLKLAPRINSSRTRLLLTFHPSLGSPISMCPFANATL